MSAMVYHGFTDRLPKTLFLTTLPQPLWGQMAEQRMEKDIGSDKLEAYHKAALPALRRFRLPKIRRKTVCIYSTMHCDAGAYLNVPERPLRVATIGRTFLDMIREPDLCGGIYHVLDIFAEHASRYLKQIVDVIDRHGKKIEKVRAGYILEERLDLSHPTIGRVAQPSAARRFAKALCQRRLQRALFRKMVFIHQYRGSRQAVRFAVKS